jgi:site-specific recombinase XerD
LELDDIDWRRGELRVRGKGRGGDPLPLLNEVGEAVACYLHDGRPGAESSKVFLTSLARLRGMKAASIGHVVRRACERTGRAPVGPHRPRHALAAEMLRQGTALPDISQVLRHRDLARLVNQEIRQDRPPLPHDRDPSRKADHHRRRSHPLRPPPSPRGHHPREPRCARA